MYIKIMDGKKVQGVMEIPSRSRNSLKEAFKQFELVNITRQEYEDLKKANA